MSTIENKRLIATFMNYAGGRPLTDGLLLSLYNDWNSIIPVIAKIYSIDDYLLSLISESGEFYFGDGVRNSEIGDAIFSNDIESAVDECVKFVQWYNEQKVVE